MRAQLPNIRGFTLIELAIVLVIIGLIAGGLMAGQSMIRSTQIQSVLTDYQNYATAMKNFQDKYGSLPGDMANATSFWGIAGGNAGDNYTVSCSAVLGTGTQTCNGNGDGMIVWASTYELFRAFQHLANAGLIAGSFTGVEGPAGAGSYDAAIGTNVPASRVSGAGYMIYYLRVTDPADPYNFMDIYGEVVTFGSKAAGGGLWNGAITPSEALSLDSKIDDGLPGSGNIKSQKKDSSFAGNCASSNDPTTAKYATTNSGSKCFLYFKTGL